VEALHLSQTKQTLVCCSSLCADGLTRHSIYGCVGPRWALPKYLSLKWWWFWYISEFYRYPVHFAVPWFVNQLHNCAQHEWLYELWSLWCLRPCAPASNSTHGGMHAGWEGPCHPRGTGAGQHQSASWPGEDWQRMFWPGTCVPVPALHAQFQGEMFLFKCASWMGRGHGPILQLMDGCTLKYPNYPEESAGKQSSLQFLANSSYPIVLSQSHLIKKKLRQGLPWTEKWQLFLACRLLLAAHGWGRGSRGAENAGSGGVGDEGGKDGSAAGWSGGFVLRRAALLAMMDQLSGAVDGLTDERLFQS